MKDLRDKILIIEFGKEACDVCKNLGENIPKYVKITGLEDRIDFVKYNMLNPTDEAVRDALWYDIPIKNAAVPSLVIDNGRTVWKKTTAYENGKADLIAGKDVIPILKSMKQDYENRTLS